MSPVTIASCSRHMCTIPGGVLCVTAVLTLTAPAGAGFTSLMTSPWYKGNDFQYTTGGATVVTKHGAPGSSQHDRGAALRSGSPGQISTCTFPFLVLTPGSTLTEVAIDYRYIVGYEKAPSGQVSCTKFNLEPSYSGSTTIYWVHSLFRPLCSCKINTIRVQGTNFSLSIVSDATPNDGGTVLYSSPHLTDYSYALNDSNYSVPVPIRWAGSAKVPPAPVGRGNGTSRLRFTFQNNDRNVQVGRELATRRFSLSCCFIGRQRNMPLMLSKVQCLQ
eukprot:SAG11_NODE_1738_length_4341_cov_3.274806_1_plen_275_part_00